METLSEKWWFEELQNTPQKKETSYTDNAIAVIILLVKKKQ